MVVIVRMRSPLRRDSYRYSKGPILPWIRRGKNWSSCIKGTKLLSKSLMSTSTERAPLCAWVSRVQAVYVGNTCFVDIQRQILAQHFHEWVATVTLYFKINNESSILTARDRQPTDNNCCIQGLSCYNKGNIKIEKPSMNGRSTGHTKQLTNVHAQICTGRS
jgi:hypothetical protein